MRMSGCHDVNIMTPCSLLSTNSLLEVYTLWPRKGSGWPGKGSDKSAKGQGKAELTLSELTGLSPLSCRAHIQQWEVASAADDWPPQGQPAATIRFGMVVAGGRPRPWLPVRLPESQINIPAS